MKHAIAKLFASKKPTTTREEFAMRCNAILDRALADSAVRRPVALQSTIAKIETRHNVTLA